jgi:Vault protein inter-alpha-trypsin domain
MRFRARLFAVLLAASACTASEADTLTAPPPRPPSPVVAVNLPPGKVTPVTTMFVATSRQAMTQDVAPPWSLTASDGSGLLLTRVDAKAVVEGPLAFTELHLYFHNPEARTREGTFAITLPTGAAVSRFAMESNGQFMEAEVVEKQLARRAYEDFLHRKQDPALLEKGEGNQFTARVFPIPASGDKHLVVSFSQEVTPGHYTLPLRGLAKSERVDVRVQVRGQSGGIAEQTMSERNWVPDRDVVVDATAIGAPLAVGAGDLASTRIKIALPNAAEVPASVTLLVDTSASRSLGFAASARTVHKLVDALARAYGGALPVQVVAFDQGTAPLYDGRADKIGDIEVALAAHGALGASDLGQALTWLASHAPKARVVVVTDGVVTAGARPEALPALARQLAARGVTRIDVALTGGIRDGGAAAAIARAGLAHTGAILDLDRGPGEVARRIGLAVRTELPVTAEGARWVFPRSIEAAQSGDEVTVYVRRDPQAQQLAVTVAGVRTVVSPVAVHPALLGRAVAGAEITELDAQLAKLTGPAADKLRAEIVKRSVAARVVSSQTSMLVLESDADYARFGIDRNALAQILAIGPSGVELIHHKLPPAQIAAPPAQIADKKKRLREDGEERKAETSAAKDSVDDRTGRGAASEDLASRIPVREPLQRVQGYRSAGPAGGAATGPSAPPPPPPPPSAMPRPEPARSGDAAGSAAGGAVISPARVTRRPPREVSASAANEQGEAIMIAGNSRDGDGLAANRRKPSLTGPLAEIAQAVADGKADVALAMARAWHGKAPGDVLALIGLGEALEAKRDLGTAARAYGSIIDLYPSRADFRRFAGERLERIGKTQRALIIDTYQRAVEQRPDHLTGHRMLAYALVRDGQYAAGFAAILAGLDRQYPANRFAGAERVISEDVGMIGAAYLAHVPGKRDAVLAELAKRSIALPTTPSTRFIMYWETDANDVDFHIEDARGGHAWYSHKQLPSGGELYADITTGYGPECFAIQGQPKAGPYRLSINYYSQGPMGYGMGLLQIQKFDGRGNLSFEDRPYVIMTNQAFVDLGSFR